MGDSNYKAGASRSVRGGYMAFAILLAIFVGASFFIIRPLAPALLWASMLSFFTYPLYRFINARVFKGKHASLSAAVNTFILLSLLVLPIGMLAATMITEAAALYEPLSNLYADKGALMEKIRSLPVISYVMASEEISYMLGGDVVTSIGDAAASFAAKISRGFVGNVFTLFFDLSVITFASFFFTRDGHVAIRFIYSILPLSDSLRAEFMTKGENILSSILYGVMLTAAVQAALCAFGWWFVGLKAVALFGMLSFVFAMVPVVGTAAIWAPGALYLYFSGETGHALTLLVWGIVVVSMADSLLKPMFISDKSHAHVLLVFVGILGGLTAWGFLGLFIGPFVLAGAYFLLSVYSAMIKKG
ncbi:AI-2E family transporter [Synergistales bacterium]|nr:AI-2E family transporter [Synergistales bacterium]